MINLFRLLFSIDGNLKFVLVPVYRKLVKPVFLLFLFVVLTGSQSFSYTAISRASASWGTTSTWRLSRTGTITCTTGSATVTGVGTSFTTELANGQVLRDANGNLIGTISSRTNNTTLVLTGNASVAVTAGAYSVQAVPANTDSVIVASGFTVTLGAARAAYYLNIETGAVLTSAGNNETITVGTGGNTGGLTLNGAITCTHNNCYTYLQGYYIKGSGYFGSTGNNCDLILNQDCKVMSGSNFIVNCTSASNSVFDMNGKTLTNYGEFSIGPNIPLTGAAGSTIVNTASGTFNYNDDASWPANVTLTATASGNTVVFSNAGSGATITMPTPTASTFHNLTIVGTGKTYTTATSYTVTGNLTLTSGTLNLVTGSDDLTMSGNGYNFINNGGTFSASGRMVTFSSNTTVSGTSTTTFGNITVSGTLVGHETKMNVAGSFTNNGTFTHNNGQVSFTNSTALGGTQISTFYDILISGTLTGISAGNFNVAGSWQNAGTFTPNGGTVTFNGSSAQNLYGATTFYNATISNSAGLTLNSNMTIGVGGVGTLQLNNNIITTGASNDVIINAGASVSRTGGTATGGYIDGNLQLAWNATGAVNKDYYIGSNSSYTPVNIAFANVTNTTSTITVSTTHGNHPGIGASLTDPNKSATRFWTYANNGVTAAAGATGTIYYPSSISGGTAANYSSQIWNGSSWTTQTACTNGTTTISGVSYKTSAVSAITVATGDIIVGELYSPQAIWNAATGNITASNSTHWIQYRTGTITSSTGSATVTGSGTLFTSEIKVGDVLLSQSTPATPIGTVTSITNNTTLVLTAVAATNNAGVSFGRRCTLSSSILPDNAPAQVNLGNTNLALADISATIDQATSIFSLTYTAAAFSYQVTLGAALTTTQTITMNNPNGGSKSNLLAIGSYACTVGGNLTIGNGGSTTTRTATVSLSTGSLTVNTNLVLSAGADAVSYLTTSGNATITLKGALTRSTYGNMVLSNGSFVFSGSSAQTIPFYTTGVDIQYNNLTINNSHASGATLGAAITSTNVAGNLTIGGILNNGGYAIAGGAGDNFTMNAGSILNLTGSSAFPTGFGGTWSLSSTSNVYYKQSTASPTISATPTYGNLYIQPQANNLNPQFTGTTAVAGDLVIGDGIKTGITMANGTAVNVGGSITMNYGVDLQTQNQLDITLKGTWTNNGTFTAGNKSVTFNGTSAQLITGDNSTTFYSLIINNSAGVTLAKNAYVGLTGSGSLTLTSGLLTTSSASLLVLYDGATASSGSTTSYVNGPMKKIGNDAFVFPIGKSGRYARIGIDNATNTNAATEFTAEYFPTPGSNRSSLQAGLNRVSNTEYWDLERTVGSSPTSDVIPTLYWMNNTWSGINATPGADLVVAHYNSSTGKWESHGQGAVSAGASGSVTASTKVTSFSPITYGSIGGVTNTLLPINLVDFKAKCKGSKVDLSWSTATEENNDYFTIEKTQDGETFEEVARIKGAGNSSQLLTYTTSDNAPYEKVSYYRLKQTDFDAKYTVSGLVAVDCNQIIGKTFEFKVYPNPSDGADLYMASTISSTEDEVLVVLYDALGKLVYSKVVVTDNGSFITAIDPYERLTPGIYIIVGTSKNEMYQQKLIIR